MGAIENTGGQQPQSVAPVHAQVYIQMTDVLRELQSRASSRENSLAITKIEEAMMWHNKDRANKGEITPSATHVH